MTAVALAVAPSGPALAAPEALGTPAREPSRTADPRVRSLFDRLPLAYEVNRGQAPEDFDFLVRCRGYHAFVSSAEVVFSLDGAGLRMSLDGAARCEPETKGLELPGRANYFLGDDPEKWVTQIPTTRGAVYRDAAPGTTWTFGGAGRALEFDFVLDPGIAGPTLRLDGAVSAKVADDGSLRIEMPRGVARISAPIAWQDLPDRRLPAVARWVAARDGVVRIDVAARDPSRRVHVDPTVTYETYLGGSQGDQALGAAMDASGNAYFCGGTSSSDFPTTNGAYDRVISGGVDGFVVKLNAAGSALVYSTYIGGTQSDEYMLDVMVDASGNALFVGSSGSSNFPTTPGVYRTSGSGGVGGVMAKLNASGSVLVFGSYTQGYARAIAPGPSGTFYVGDSDGIARYSAAATVQHFYNLLRPTGPQPNGGFSVYDCASDADGYVYVVGSTNWNYPATAGAFQTSNAGGADAFVTKLDSDGSTVYSTWLGGSSGEEPYAVDVNLAGQAYVVGFTQSSNFPVTSDAYKSTITSTTSAEAFLTRLGAAGTTLRYSTFLGRGVAETVAVHGGSSCVVAGYTQDSTFGLLDAFQSTYGGNQDSFAMKFHRDGTLAWSTYVGGSDAELTIAVGMGPDGSCALTGVTSSSDLPTVSAYQSSSNGPYEPFAVKVPDTLPTVTPLSITTSAVPTWTVDYYFSQQLAGTGGVDEHTWSFAGGSLPAGVGITAGGLISGTPTQTGAFAFKVGLSDTSDLYAEREFSWRVNPPPSIASATMADATSGTAYDRGVPVADGSGTMSFELLSGDTPPGTSFGPDGRVTGTPTQTGDFAFTVRVTDGRGATGSGETSIRVNAPPAIVATPMPGATESRPYTAQFATTGGSAPFLWSVVGGGIPTAEAIEGAAGRLNGTARPAGTYSFTVRATDAAGAKAERLFAVTVNPLPQITAAALPTAAAGRPYSFVVPRSGGTAPLTWVLDASDLPAGLTLDEATGEISGTSVAPPGTAVVLACTDARGARATAGYALDVAAFVDLERGARTEKLRFQVGTPRVVQRYLELTQGALLDIDVVGGAADGSGPELRVYDASGAEWDLFQWTKASRRSVKVKHAPVPATGRWFLSATAASGFVGRMKLTVRVAPSGRWRSGATFGPSDTPEYLFSAPPGSALSIFAKSAKGGAALPRIVSVVGPDGIDLLPGGTTKERGGAATFSTKTRLAGGDYRVTFSTRDGTAGDVAWTVRLKLPSKYAFALPDLAAGD